MSSTIHGPLRVAGVDKPVSALALGTATLRSDDKDAWFRLYDRFVELGGTVLDTGHIYGESEEIIGAWMADRGNRDTLFIFTKGGHGSDHQLPSHGLAEAIERELKESLRRLRTDYVDLYGLHRDNPSLPVGPIVECLNEHVRKGRARALCASNWQPARVQEANEYADKHGLAGFAVVSNNLSLAVPAEPFYPNLVFTDEPGRQWHQRTGIPLFSWSSQARGFFTGRFRPETMPASTESREGWIAKRMLEVFWSPGNAERLRRAEELGRQKSGCSAMQIALAWVARQPLKVVPIVGPRTIEELESCAAALSIELSPREAKWLNLES
jgi:aryl-alcohol dehydrogenase-like predicted oxidoreductase